MLTAAQPTSGTTRSHAKRLAGRSAAAVTFQTYLRSLADMNISRLWFVHTELPDFSMPNEEQANLAAESFRMLADATRVKLLWALLQGESSVTCLADLVGATPTAVSQHLAKLRLARLVKTRREGTFVFYSAADVHVRRLLDEALFHADHADRDLPDYPGPDRDTAAQGALGG